MSAVPTIGRLLLANVVTGACIAVMLLVDRRRWMWAALAAAYCIATLGSFLWSVQFGLFGYQETLRGTWQNAPLWSRSRAPSSAPRPPS